MSRRAIGGVVSRAQQVAVNILDAEPFSGGFGLWSTPGSDDPEQTWTRSAGSSPTNTGGPDGGSDPATRQVQPGNSYAFTEADLPGAFFSLESPAADASLGLFGLTFDVHMRFGSQGGISDGTLRVQGWNGSAWSNIGNAIVGSQQATASTPYVSSAAFSAYNSTGFSNNDFKFRFLFEKGASEFQVNYDAAVDNVVITGPEGAVLTPDEGGGEPPDNQLFPSPLFGGQFASWAIPASEIATHPNSASLLNDLFTITPGRFNVNSEKFTPVIWDIQDADTTITFDRTSFNFGGNLNDGAQIPWNFSLFSTPRDFDATDGDSYLVLYDSVTGLCYDFFQSERVGGTLRGGRGTLITTGVDNDGPNANIFIKQNAVRNVRACGIQHVVGPVLRSEVDAGRIPHAMTLIWPQPTRFAHEPFAIKGAGGNNPDTPNRGFMGLRVVWELTDNDIDSWVATLPVAARTGMRVVANCLREFGGFGADSGGSIPNRRGATQFEHQLSAQWQEIGMQKSNVQFALHTLLEPNQNKARVLDIPVHADGTDASVACYPGVPYPGGHPCNGVV